ncbi:MAG TPA: hypothetical protein VK141_00205, partial [Nitrosomonas sp.]|nr:hypothetical protein [Nitrosomonas sp.]
DSLFQFKLGFSKDLHDFKTWRWILLPSVYDRLMMENSGKKRRNIENEDLADFFPQYRFF